MYVATSVYNHIIMYVYIKLLDGTLIIVLSSSSCCSWLFNNKIAGDTVLHSRQ